MDMKTKTKKPSSPKFNVFDIVIISILLLAIIVPIVLVIRAENENNAVGKNEVLYYTVRIDNITAESVSKIAKRQTVLERGTEIGTVYSGLTPLYYRNYEKTEDGNLETVIDDSGLCYIEVTIKATAVYNDVEGYTINGKRIAVGRTLELRFPDFEATGVCVGLNGR